MDWPTDELVAMAWLQTVPGVIASQVATTLPANPELWADAGFIQVGPAGGSPNIYLPVGQPVISCQFWATILGSDKPPWGKANTLAQKIKMHCLYPQAGSPVERTVVTKNGYMDARVMSAYPLTEPARVPSDEASYARYTMDVAFHWVHIEEAP